MYNSVFYILLIILVFGYVLERVLDHLNAKHWSTEVPEELREIIGEDQYRKSQQYHRENRRFGLITSTFSFILVLLMLFVGGFAWVDQLASRLTDNPILISLLFFAIIGFGMDLLNLPFSGYDTFVIEEKYGFNKTSVSTFFTDKLKGWILTALLGGGLLTAILWFYQKTGNDFWWIAWILVTGVMILMNLFYSQLIVPLFNKQTPLQEGSLRDQVIQLSQKAGFRLQNIYVMDGSKRSSKANAYFSGLGPKKRIVLFDTLIEELEPEEVLAVLAHEIGHYKMKHSLQGMLDSVLQTGLTLYILSLLVGNPALSAALGSDHSGFHLGLIAFGILYTPVSLVLGLLTNFLSRKNEFAADAFARELLGGEALASGLKKLSVNHLSNLRPHPVFVFFHYSHPPLLSRLAALSKGSEES